MPSAVKRVLVVDDENGMLDVYRIFLTDAGYELGFASNGLEALSIFGASSWDAIITDLRMPEMDGEELAEGIRKLNSAVPIILVTGQMARITRADLFDGVFPKPFHFTDFLTHLRLLLDPS